MHETLCSVVPYFSLFPSLYFTFPPSFYGLMNSKMVSKSLSSWGWPCISDFSTNTSQVEDYSFMQCWALNSGPCAYLSVLKQIFYQLEYNTSPHCLILKHLKVVYCIYFVGRSHVMVGMWRQRIACRRHGKNHVVPKGQTQIFRRVPFLAEPPLVLPLVLKVNHISCIPPFLSSFPWAEIKSLHRIIEYLCVLSSEICIVFLVPTLNLQLWQHTMCDVF